MKTGFHAPLESLTTSNQNFRQVLYTGAHTQLVLMCLAPLEDIGLETHPDNDQFFRFESGEGKVVINESTYIIKSGDCIIIPAGSAHNIINTSSKQTLQLYTLYSPPHHQDKIVRATKAAVEASAPEFAGQTTE